MRRLSGTVVGAALLLVLATALPRLQRPSAATTSIVRGETTTELVTTSQGEEHEPNDRWTEAVALEPGVHQFSISHDRDLDWFKVWVSEPASQITVTLSDLPTDYDLALLGDPVRNDGNGWPLAPMADLAEVDASGQFISGGEIHDLGAIEPVGALRAISVRRGTSPERVSITAFDAPGWYYVLVKGYNGAYRPAPYTLTIRITPPPPSSRSCNVGFSPEFRAGTAARSGPVWAAKVMQEAIPWSATPSPQTLILWNGQRFARLYGATSANALLAELQRLAAHPAVQGLIQPVENDLDVMEAYAAWDADACNPDAANRVTRVIKGLVDRLFAESPTLRQVLIVGSDPVIPFHRVPDRTRIGNERGYADRFAGDAQTPLTATLIRGMILTDDFYATSVPRPWQGRELYIPDRSVGRLVETPEEIMGAVRSFLASDGRHHLQTALVLGAPALIEGSRQIESAFRGWGLLTEALIGDDWDAVELRDALLNRHHDVKVIHARTAHNRIFAPVAVGDPVTAEEDVAEVGAGLAGTLILSAGSHLGLNVPDPWAEAEERLDFSQLLTGLGATTVASTSYSYGGLYIGDLSEKLTLLFVEALAESPSGSVGEALVRAKRRLFEALGPAGLSAYYEKSLMGLTLYGFPMLQVDTAGLQGGGAESPPRFPTSLSSEPSPLQEVAPGLAVSRIEVSPRFRPVSTPEGVYFSADDGIAAWPGRPVQPRVVIDLTEPDQAAHGVLLVAAQFRELRGFDPLVAQPRTEKVTPEPYYPPTTWWPRRLAAINRMALAGVPTERLIVVAGQYRSPGVERLYSRLTFEVYYSNAADFRPPFIWQVEFMDTPQGADFNVWAVDRSGIQRAVVTYTLGDGQWQSLELQDVGMGTHWFGFVPRLDGQNLEFFVQVVDRAGNVAVHTDKGRLFRQYAGYLPVVRR